MANSREIDALRDRVSPFDMSPAEFRELGHWLVERLAGLLESLRDMPVAPDEPRSTVLNHLGPAPLSESGTTARAAVETALAHLIDHSLYNNHPRFWGYIVGSGCPLGAFGDLVAAMLNPTVSNWQLGPAASAFEVQAVRWIAELLGLDAPVDGLLLSGGTVANIVCMHAARTARRLAVSSEVVASVPRIYASQAAHTWVREAADLMGLPPDALVLVECDRDGRLDVAALERRLAADQASIANTIAVVATAGTTSTGAIDPLAEISALCRERGLWLHIDGAYGAAAAASPEAPPGLRDGLALGDSVAIDPHKWLYVPLEAGCALVRHQGVLYQAFQHDAVYYAESGIANLSQQLVPFRDMGIQTLRGFRALKVWLCLAQAGRAGYEQMITADILLAQRLFELVEREALLEARTQSLSITTFRYVPTDLRHAAKRADVRDYLNHLNEQIIAGLQRGGVVYPSHTTVHGDLVVRACIVNFRTRLDDIERLPPLVVQLGDELDRELRPASGLVALSGR